MSNTGKPLLVLLAEDDDGHATLIRRNLARAGVVNDVVHVKDGQQALDYLFRRGGFADRPADQNILLLLDINMPLLSGVDVLRVLKGTEATARTPVIMLTTTDDPRDVEKCYALGCSVYIAKPVRYESFVEAIHRLGLFLEIIKVPSVNGKRGAD
jgi:CheY-like chemotaxis protein